MPPAEELYAKVLSLQGEVADPRAQVAWFQRQMFAGGRSEKLPVESSAQVKLGLPETPQAEAPTRTVTYERRTPAPEKRPIPAEIFAQLPGHETIELIPDEVKAQPADFEQISEERTFEVDLIGPKLVKREIVRPKFRRKTDRDAAPVIAPALPRPVAGGYHRDVSMVTIEIALLTINRSHRGPRPVVYVASVIFARLRLLVTADFVVALRPRRLPEAAFTAARNALTSAKPNWAGRAAWSRSRFPAIFYSSLAIGALATASARIFEVNIRRNISGSRRNVSFRGVLGDRVTTMQCRRRPIHSLSGYCFCS